MASESLSFYQRYYVWILLAFAAAFPFVLHGKILSQLTNNNNVRQWLPSHFEATEIYDEFQRHFGTDEFAIVSWEGCALDDPRLDTYIGLLNDYRDADNESLFARVTTGPMLLDELTGSPFFVDRDAALERLKGVAIGRDGNATCAIVVLNEKGDANRRRTVDEMRRLLVDELGVPEEAIHMTGDAVTNAEVDIASEQAIGSLVTWSTIIAVACAFISLRSIPLVAIVFGVAVYSSFFPEWLLYVVGGNMNLVLVVMPVLIYVLSLSAGVHLVNYYRDAISEDGLYQAPLRAVAHGWLPCTLAAGTTAIGLGSLYVSQIKPVKDFGFYSACGILGSLAFLFLLLPSLLVADQKLNPWLKRRLRKDPATAVAEEHLFDRIIAALGDFVLRHRIIMASVCLLLLLVVGWGAFRINTSVRPRRFFDKDSRLIRDYDWLAAENRFGPQVPIELVVRFRVDNEPHDTLTQMQLVSDLQQQLEQVNVDDSHLIGSCISAVTFAPVLDPTHYERYTMNRRLTENLPAYHDVHYYSSLSEDDAQVDLWRISARVEAVELDYDEVIAQVAVHVDQFLDQRRQQRAEKVTEIERRKEETLRQSQEALAKARQRYADEPERLAKFEQQIDDFVYNMERKSNAMQAALQDDTTGVDVIYTGMVPLFHEAQNELLSSLFRSFLLAFVLIAVLMVVWFRSIRAGLITMFPNIFPAAIIFGGMGWTGTIVDIGSMMTASVAMGIAVDDTVHFLTWFRRGLSQGMSNRDAMLHAYRRCALAMTQTTAIAGLSILVFRLSSFQPVSQFGLLMFVLLVAALVGDLVFLPALLAGRAGRLFHPGTSKEVPQPAEQAVA